MLWRSWVSVGVLLVFLIACSDDEPGGGAVDTGQSQTDVRRRSGPQDRGTQADVEDLSDAGIERVDTAEPDTFVDTGALPDLVEVIDLPADPDLGRVEPPDTGTFEIPAATEDCEPLGIPTQWEGTFDGEAVSNIPDMLGYTFNGSVHGGVNFEIRCVDTKLMVFGDLDGDTNCALDTGCPFTARMEGVYDPETRHMEGQLHEGVIDYTVVQVFAEGEFEGDLDDDMTLSGTWSGEKVDISSPILSGVTATASGTWEASPDDL